MTGSDSGTCTLSFDRFDIELRTRRLSRDGAAVRIGARAFDILWLLAEAPGQVLEHRYLMERAWAGRVVGEANLRVQIAALRRALDTGGVERYILNVPGRGYLLTAPVVRR
ncbi:winged helix-turn-helix domain-containing protein [Telluria beijingensis]|uniref:winged helix-turn-helix domain-containing protein n=1 Tax=Telluria beijingensis TaxID=3068633 RepID=UPI0027960E93|nr:winged helix-turn-helix domain-containing protein [Massilia sp. REN29]